MIVIHLHRTIHSLQQRLFVDTGYKETALIQSLRTFRTGTNTNSRERMANTCEERRLFRQGPTIRNYSVGIHLKAIVIMETKWLMLYYTRVQLKPRSFQPLATPWMATVQDRHIVLLCHLINCSKEREEVFLRINILLSVSRKKNIMTFLQTQSLMNVRGFNFGQVLMQNLSHRRTRDIGTFLRQSTVGQIATCMLRICHVHIANDIHYSAVRLLRQALVLASVACLHMEDRDMQTLCTDNAEA